MERNTFMGEDTIWGPIFGILCAVVFFGTILFLVIRSNIKAVAAQKRKAAEQEAQLQRYTDALVPLRNRKIIVAVRMKDGTKKILESWLIEKLCSMGLFIINIPPELGDIIWKTATVPDEKLRDLKCDYLIIATEICRSNADDEDRPRYVIDLRIIECASERILGSRVIELETRDELSTLAAFGIAQILKEKVA